MVAITAKLIQPVVPLPAFSTPDGPGSVIDNASLLDRWQLVQLRNSACDDECLRDLYWLASGPSRPRIVTSPDVGLLLISQVEVSAEVRAQITELADDFAIIDGESRRTAG